MLILHKQVSESTMKALTREYRMSGVHVGVLSRDGRFDIVLLLGAA